VFNQCQSVYGDIQTAVTDAIHAWMNSGAKDPAMFTDLLTQALKNGANRQGSSEGLGS